MTKEEAKKVAQQVINTLTNVNFDDLLDDGNDNNDYEQNMNFCYATQDVESMHEKLARVDIDGMEGETMEEAWKKAWGEHYDPCLPECKYNHAIAFAHWILSL